MNKPELNNSEVRAEQVVSKMPQTLKLGLDVHAETIVVVRILDKAMLQLDMTKLGFEEKSLNVFKKQIVRPWGIILVTGPTGSGKTNTLYSAISNLNSMEKNIMN